MTQWYRALALWAILALAKADGREDVVGDVVEVKDPEAKRQIFEDFSEGRRSILYDSFLPRQSDALTVAFEEIVVESVPLRLQKPANPGRKLREQQAEARRASLGERV